MSNQHSEWLTIREAASALGVSDLTIRRRIKDGKIAHRLNNGKYFVNLSAPVPAHPRITEHTSTEVPDHPGESDYSNAGEYSPAQEYSDTNRADESHHVVAQLNAMLPEYARLAERAGRAALLEQQYDDLQERYRALESSVVSLASRNGWLESKLEEREQEVRLLTDSQRPRPWWKRLFGAAD